MYYQSTDLDLCYTLDLVHYYMPFDFQKKFPKIRVILDGLDIPVKKKQNHLVVARQATFNNYKNHNHNSEVCI